MQLLRRFVLAGAGEWCLMSIADRVAGPAGATETVSSGAAPSAAPAIAIPISGERELRLDLFRGLALWLILSS